MKKVINITIQGQMFYIEEDAYEKLTQYLDSIAKKFTDNPDKQEIITDIELAVAEHLRQLITGQKQAITPADITLLTAKMGTVQDIAGTPEVTTESTTNTSDQASAQKKLFRNPDNVILAGVASGLAEYFSLDPLLVRVLFVIATLLWGWGIIVYLILWIVMPEAKTVSEKLTMNGDPVTIDKIEAMVKQAVAATKQGADAAVELTKKNETTLKKIVRFPFEILGYILQGIGDFFKTISNKLK